MQNKKGFTIIELLVVIAIIAVLAAVVLVNVTGYINKGKDAAAKGNLATLATAGAVFFDGAGNYTGFNTGAEYNKIKNSLVAAGYATVTSTVSETAWCTSVLLKASTNIYCVDSTGNKKESNTSTCASQVCP